MFLNRVMYAIRSRLAAKLIFVVVLLLTAVSVLLTSFFISRQKSLLTEELYKRTHSLAQNLAYNSRNSVISDDKTVIQSLVSGVKEEPDIENVFLTDSKGTILASTKSPYSSVTISVPTQNESTIHENWFSADTPSLKRVITPITVTTPIVDTDNVLDYCSKDTVTFENKNISDVSFYFSSYANNNDEIYCNSNVLNIKSDLSFFGISRKDRTVRLLIESGCNAFWSHNGQYITFFNMKTHELSVLDTLTGTVTVLVKTEIFPISCFSPDDRYVITTLPTNSGEKLFRIPRDGGNHEQLTFHYGRHWWPNCSPDGKWIVYTEYIDKVMYVFNTETKKSTRVFPDLQDMTGAGRFSPDGTQFCYMRCFDPSSRSWDIFVADLNDDGTFKKGEKRYGRQITFTGEHKTIFEWSPDGKWLTYSQGKYGGKHNVWIVPAQGGEPTNLTSSLPLHEKRLGYAILHVSTENLNRAIREGNRTALLITLVCAGIGIISAIVMVRNIVRPVKTMAHAAGEFARGNFDQAISTQRHDEIGILTDTFDRMMRQLKMLIGEKDERNRELEKAYRELETLDTAKDDFISLVSHELRTPLSSIILYTQMLLDGQIDSREKRERYLTTIITNARRLARLVNDVLDLSKIETGVMPFEEVPLQAQALIDEAVKEFTPVLTAHDIQLVCEDMPGNIFFIGDRDKTMQVITNILSNAIKYTSSGGTINLSIAHDEDMATIAFKDTGKGIPEKDIPKIFDRFFQLENIEHHSDGSGLGMTISKSIVEHQGGEIWVESELGKGTKVYFTVPLAKDITGHSDSGYQKEDGNSNALLNAGDNSKTTKILIVDDEEAIRTALYDCITNAGLKPIAAQNGEEALRCVEKYHPKLVILDVMMPGMSGLEVCSKLRNDPITKRIKIIMLSARGQVKEKEEGLKAGADRYITKPFDYADLIRVIRELIGK